MHQIGVVLVDDHPIVRQGLRRVLELAPQIKVLGEAANGESAIEIARSLHPDVILMDLNLPDMDGLSLCRELRHKGVKSPIIMLTAHGSETDTVKGLDAGANDYVAKPFRLAVLLARMRAQLRQYEMSDDAT
ncbi:MAG: response regulator, partial [Syntrophomonadaceae bacterium]|nr:response regulator [Syntrophomonadaceae bacterium]